VILPFANTFANSEQGHKKAPQTKKKSRGSRSVFLE